jgi:hypothetical protein
MVYPGARKIANIQTPQFGSTILIFVVVLEPSVANPETLLVRG